MLNFQSLTKAVRATTAHSRKIETARLSGSSNDRPLPQISILTKYGGYASMICYFQKLYVLDLDYFTNL